MITTNKKAVTKGQEVEGNREEHAERQDELRTRERRYVSKKEGTRDMGGWS